MRKNNKFDKSNRKHSEQQSLVSEALAFIEKHTNNSTVFACYDMRGHRIDSFGVYNYITKKYSLHYTNKFYESDFNNLKEVTLAR